VTPKTWPCPTPDGGRAEGYALVFDQARSHRLLIIPALFDEANRMRRFTVEVMRRLDNAGIDCILPDLPGCNESLQDLSMQTPTGWQAAMTVAAAHFGATHVLGIRGGALLTPGRLPAWHYAPAKGGSILRQLIRSRILMSREAGINEYQDDLLRAGLMSGLELSGFRLNAAFFDQFPMLLPPQGATEIAQDMIGGSGLWLRAEPDEDRQQADALAKELAIGMKA
jgi:hypothetical protein